jgi:murein L,D-transpeptidase YcbB/YkuD
MEYISRILKLLFLGVWLYGSCVFAQEQNISTAHDQNQTHSSDLLFCDTQTQLKKNDLFSNLINPKATKEFYTNYCKKTHTPAWNNSLQELSKQSQELMQSIQESYDHGLNPNKYHLEALVEYKTRMRSDDANQTLEQKYRALYRMDVVLTDAYISLAKDLYYGFTNWKQFKESKKEKNKKLLKNQEEDQNEKDDVIEWERAVKAPIYPAKELIENLAMNKIAHSLAVLSPDCQEYRRLMKSLKYYRMLHANGGWEKIPSGPTIRTQQSDNRLALIKKRLYITGELPEIENNATTLYDEPKLIDAVKLFQESHNLMNDGLIGKKTINALNISSATKISKIILNLERYRWLHQGLDQYPSYININIPAFRMQVFEHGEEVFGMKVIVGKQKRPTPVLNSKISYAVLNPTWTAPKTIVKEDILQKESMDEYLESHSMRIYSNVEGEMVEVQADDINWSDYMDKENVPFTFKADAGETNPLGEVKFIFNNNYSVFMHDTNQRDLFKNEYRALSSGCLRLGEPMRLLSYLLEKKDAIIEKEDDEEADKIVNLKKKVPVVIRYMTVSVDKNDHIYFYDDIYGFDALQKESIKDNSWML